MFNKKRECEKSISMDSFSHCIISSQLNTRYIQPHYPLSDNIVSHSVSLECLNKIKDVYENRHNRSFVSRILTKYYDMNRVYSVADDKKIEYKVIYRNDHKVLDYFNDCQTTLEYVGENQFPLNANFFQIKKKYNHERQLILQVLDTVGYRIELESLLVGLTGDVESQMSHSFRLVIKSMNKDELHEHVEILKEILSESHSIQFE